MKTYIPIVITALLIAGCQSPPPAPPPVVQPKPAPTVISHTVTSHPPAYRNKGGETQSLEGPALKQGVPTEILVVLSADPGTLWIDGREVARNEKMTLNADDVNATECYLGRGRDGDYFRGEIDPFEVYSVALKDELPPTPNPAKLISEPLFVNPTTAVMQAEVGVDPLGGVEYYFAETSGNPGGDDSGFTALSATSSPSPGRSAGRRAHSCRTIDDVLSISPE